MPGSCDDLKWVHRRRIAHDPDGFVAVPPVGFEPTLDAV